MKKMCMSLAVLLSIGCAAVQSRRAAQDPDLERPTEQENKIWAARYAELERAYSDLVRTHEKVLADLDAMIRTLEAQATVVRERDLKLTELRDKLVKMVSEKNTAIQELQYVRQDLERVSKDLATLEERHVQVVKEKRKLEEALAAIRLKLGIAPPAVPPAGPVLARVMSYSEQAGIAIINKGKNQGVQVGMGFLFKRGDEGLGDGVVKEVAADWCAVQLGDKAKPLRVGDDAASR
jgi:septal ring factor EnvC (AmiA/AmiB activator)